MSMRSAYPDGRQGGAPASPAPVGINLVFDMLDARCDGHKSPAFRAAPIKPSIVEGT